MLVKFLGSMICILDLYWISDSLHLKDSLFSKVFNNIFFSLLYNLRCEVEVSGQPNLRRLYSSNFKTLKFSDFQCFNFKTSFHMETQTDRQLDGHCTKPIYSFSHNEQRIGTCIRGRLEALAVTRALPQTEQQPSSSFFSLRSLDIGTSVCLIAQITEHVSQRWLKYVNVFFLNPAVVWKSLWGQICYPINRFWRVLENEVHLGQLNWAKKQRGLSTYTSALLLLFVSKSVLVSARLVDTQQNALLHTAVLLQSVFPFYRSWCAKFYFPNISLDRDWPGFACFLMSVTQTCITPVYPFFWPFPMGICY